MGINIKCDEMSADVIARRCQKIGASFTRIKGGVRLHNNPDTKLISYVRDVLDVAFKKRRQPK